MLQIDYEIDQILQKIEKQLVRQGHGNVDRATIISVIESQLEGLVSGMAAGCEVVFPYLGRFTASKRRIDALNKKYEVIGKKAGLVDRGVYRMSFLKNGQELGEVDTTGFKASTMLPVPDKYQDNAKAD